MGKKPINEIKIYNESLSEDQREAKRVIDNNAITILSGAAGSGKTYLASSYALEKLSLEKKRGGINKIIITRPTISRKEDDIGFMPGGTFDKMELWLKPLISNIEKVEGVEKTNNLFRDKFIEILPLMFVQGVTFDNAITIVDEASNLSKKGMEMIFTRLGRNSKLIFCGDARQSLLDIQETGYDRLMYLSKTKRVNGLGSYELTSNFRHDIVRELLEIY